MGTQKWSAQVRAGTVQWSGRVSGFDPAPSQPAAGGDCCPSESWFPLCKVELSPLTQSMW